MFFISFSNSWSTSKDFIDQLIYRWKKYRRKYIFLATWPFLLLQSDPVGLFGMLYRSKPKSHKSPSFMWLTAHFKEISLDAPKAKKITFDDSDSRLRWLNLNDGLIFQTNSSVCTGEKIYIELILKLATYPIYVPSQLSLP